MKFIMINRNFEVSTKLIARISHKHRYSSFTGLFDLLLERKKLVSNKDDSLKKNHLFLMTDNGSKATE